MSHKTIKVSALSIVTHPHSPENYIKLLKKAEKLDRPVNLRGETYATLSFVHPLEKNQKEPGPISGEFIKYTDIDVNSEWYNIASKETATEAELAKIKALPKNLKPNMSRFSFIFYPDKHIMIFETNYDNKSFSTNYAQKTLSSLFIQPEIFEEFGKVHVHIIPETDTVDLIINDKSLSYLHMHIIRPNPDDIKTAEAKFKKRLKRLNAEKQDLTLYPPKGEQLALDKEEKTLAKIAAKNGFIEAKVVNIENNRVETVSTKEHPLKESVIYNPKTTDAFSQLKQIAPTLIEKVASWMNK